MATLPATAIAFSGLIDVLEGPVQGYNGFARGLDARKGFLPRRQSAPESPRVPAYIEQTTSGSTRLPGLSISNETLYCCTISPGSLRTGADVTSLVNVSGIGWRNG